MNEQQQPDGIPTTNGKVMVEDVEVLDWLVENQPTPQQQVLQSTDKQRTTEQAGIIDQCIERLEDIAEYLPYTKAKHVRAQMATLLLALEIDEVEAMFSDDIGVMESALRAYDWRMGRLPQGIVTEWEKHLATPHAAVMEMLGQVSATLPNFGNSQTAGPIE